MEKIPTLLFTNPATGEQFGQVAMTPIAEIHLARQSMHTAARVWAQTPVAERVKILRKFQGVLVDALDEISEVMNMDTGKSRQDALIEAFVTVDMLQAYLSHAPRWLKPRRVPSGLYIFKRCYVDPRPYGVVAVLAPWNYPLALSLPPVLAALLAGNTVILKPSEVTAATGVLIEKLFQRVPELSPFVRVIHGDGSVGAALVDSKPDYIFLTGSTLTGKRVLQAAAEHLIPVASELGGKDAMIVLEDADIQAAAHWGVWGAFFNTGQTCMAVERVYVVESVYDEFVRLAVEETSKLKVGFSTEIDNPNYLGPVSDPRQIKTIERHLEDGLSKGATILLGGKRSGMFVEPTVLVNVTHDMLLMRDETFGPLMPIMKVKDEHEAIRMANDNAFGLGASIWSRDLERAYRVAHQVEASSIVINDTIAQFAVPMLPFGGIKQSGYGRTHGKEGIMQFTRPYAYVVGETPFEWDIATLARRPGHYHFLASVVRFLFGVNTRQRMQPVKEAINTTALKKPRLALGLGALLGAAAFAGFAFLKKNR
jgi:acyl-CoA reductase-like NAD-dependent aldehyde dehydrogenase